MTNGGDRRYRPLILVALNELNIEFIRKYVEHGKLPTFARLLLQHGCITTTSEKNYQELEPWIQWVSVHTGLPLRDHGVFRLGDIVDAGQPQIWEHLEQTYGCRVGALSPMNAANRSREPAFFVPDPWTKTPVTGDALLQHLSEAVARGVNENASGSGSLSMYGWLLAGLARYSLPVSGPQTLRLAWRALRQKYARAILLDRLLADVFVTEWRQHRPDFASLFLNGAAHIQHHYLFNAGAYEGPNRNPEWYAGRGMDPVYEVYEAYDAIVSTMLDIDPDARLVFATGLSQSPVQTPVYYYRLRNHAEFLRLVGAPFENVYPRMSRDFLVSCGDEQTALRCEARLSSCADARGEQLFETDNRGASLFVTLIYPHEITPGFTVYFEGGDVHGFEEQVAFVALKNGEHDGNGYLIDTGAPAVARSRTMPLTEVFALIESHFEEQIRTHERRPAKPVPAAV